MRSKHQFFAVEVIHNFSSRMKSSFAVPQLLIAKFCWLHFKIFICWFSVVLGLHCCTDFFLIAARRGYSLVAVSRRLCRAGFSCCWAQAPGHTALNGCGSQQLQCMSLDALAAWNLPGQERTCLTIVVDSLPLSRWTFLWHFLPPFFLHHLLNHSSTYFEL